MYLRSTCIAVLTLFLTSVAQSSTFQLQNDRNEVEKAYAKFASSSPIDRMKQLSEMHPVLQTDLWALHFEKFLEAHTVTPEQRSVFLEAFGLLSSGALDPARGVREAWVNEALAENEAHATKAFANSPEAMVTAFVLLGNPTADLHSSRQLQIASTSKSLPLLPHTLAPPGSQHENCTCSGESNYCGWWPTDPGPYCYVGLGFCNPLISGCGWLSGHPCDGMCWNRKPPGLP